MNRRDRDAETPREDKITGEINVPVLKDGLKRLVNNYSSSSASPRLGGFPSV